MLDALGIKPATYGGIPSVLVKAYPFIIGGLPTIRRPGRPRNRVGQVESIQHSAQAWMQLAADAFG
jgi:hypothetical protein